MTASLAVAFGGVLLICGIGFVIAMMAISVQPKKEPPPK